MVKDTYLNIVTFPLALEFKNKALGIRRGIKIGDLSGSIYIPNGNLSALDKTFRELLPPRVKNIELAVRVEQQTSSDQNEFELHWGSYFTWNPKDPENTAIATVRRAVITFAAAQDGQKLSVEELGKRCLEKFPAWSRRLIDWIEVLTGVDLNAAHPLHGGDDSLWISAAWIHPEGTGFDYSFINPLLSLYGSFGENSLDAKLWTQAIQAANQGREIPEIWALIRDARAAQRRDLGRRAVLDAATATELIIEKNLRLQLLRSQTKIVVNEIMRSSWKVSQRVKLMTCLGMFIPQNLKGQLLDLRNKVVHENEKVKKTDAQHAVDAAEQLARHYEADSLKG